MAGIWGMEMWAVAPFPWANEVFAKWHYVSSRDKA